jgi:protein arginine N-methyltransferase 1
MIEVARQSYRANGWQDRVVFLQELSSRAQLPEQVDVVVADQMGGFGVGAGICEYFYDARQRFLKPGGVLLPHRLDLLLALAESPETWEQINFWETARAGFDFRHLRTRAANTLHKVELTAGQLLSDTQTAYTLEFRSEVAGRAAECTLEATRAGTLHGLTGCFQAYLSAQIQMTNSPLADAPINRHLMFFPLEQPVALQAGDRAEIKMRISPIENIYTWQVEVWDAPRQRRKASFKHSTFRSLLMTAEELRRTRPASQPCLTERGAARLSVLQWCDGQRTLTEIEALAYQTHRNFFGSAEEAAKFVAEVISHNCP